MDIRSRAAWGARSAKSLTRMPWARVRYSVLHWPGRRSPIALTDSAVAAALRGWQAYHQGTQGWSDIAYNHAVDQRGVAWTLRGFDRQDGSVKNMGGQVYSVLLADGTGAAPSDAAKRTILALFDEADRRAGRRLRRTYHGGLVSTDCAGPGSNAWAKAGFPHPPAPNPNPVPEEDIMASIKDLDAAIERATPAIAAAVVDTFMRHYVDVSGGDGAKRGWVAPAARALAASAELETVTLPDGRKIRTDDLLGLMAAKLGVPAPSVDPQLVDAEEE